MNVEYKNYQFLVHLYKPYLLTMRVLFKWQEVYLCFELDSPSTQTVYSFR